MESRQIEDLQSRGRSQAVTYFLVDNYVDPFIIHVNYQLILTAKFFCST